eukprot:Opistho-2@10252
MARTMLVAFVTFVAISMLTVSTQAGDVGSPSHTHGGVFGIICLALDELTGSVVSGAAELDRTFTCTTLTLAKATLLTCNGRYFIDNVGEAGNDISFAYDLGKTLDTAKYVVVKVSKNGAVKVAFATDSEGVNVVSTPLIELDGPTGGNPAVPGKVVPGITSLPSITCQASSQPYALEFPAPPP